jgi:hypothetical protein
MGDVLFTVSDLARRLDVRPREISDLFYARRLPESFCRLVGGRRLIPEESVPAIVAALARQKKKK